MRAIVFEAAGERLKEVELPDPTPRAGQVLLAIRRDQDDNAASFVAVSREESDRSGALIHSELSSPSASSAPSAASNSSFGSSLRLRVVGGHDERVVVEPRRHASEGDL